MLGGLEMFTDGPENAFTSTSFHPEVLEDLPPREERLKGLSAQAHTSTRTRTSNSSQLEIESVNKEHA